MDKDFHYYATYTAARLAGFDYGKAVTIAHAAQYVDNSNYQRVYKYTTFGQDYSYWLDDISEFTPHPTIQELSELGDADLNPLRFNDGFLNKLRRIWACFHFLPGNYGDTPNQRTYRGPKKGFFWEYDAAAKQAFTMMCLPNSPLARLMVNDLVDKHAGAPYRLHLIGLRMHVLADTWAHTFYAGTPASWVNNVRSAVLDLTTDPATEEKFELGWLDKRAAEMATPAMPSYTSLAYLGHGRMAHLPDHPWMTYAYRPDWLDDWLTKDNPADYMKAFHQMVAAMRCIESGTRFDAESPSGLSVRTVSVIDAILRTAGADKRLPDKRCELWREVLDTVDFDGDRLGAPPPYDEDAWLNELKRAADQKATDYYRFNKSAALHIALVAGALKEHTGIVIDEDIDSLKIPVRIRNAGFAYVGATEFGDDYRPRLAAEGVVLDLCLEAGKTALVSGDKVRIRTHEVQAGEYNELGAWSSASLYYYTRNADKDKQTWIVEKVAGSAGTTIRLGDTVRFKNLSYRQNMMWYVDDEDGAGGYHYLTTSTGTGAQTQWILEAPQPAPQPAVTYRSIVRLQSDNADYVSHISGNPTQYYPTVATEAVGLTFYLAAEEAFSAGIRHGDIVKIKTTEDAVASFNYLGAWATPALYWYTKDNDVKKQTWKIEKVTNTHDPEVRQGDKVVLRNQSWTAKPFLTRYRDGDAFYLTTQGDATLPRAQWVIRT